MANDEAQIDAVELATELTIAWLSNPNTRPQASDVPDFLRTMHAAVTGLDATSGTDPESPSEGLERSYEPAVTVRKSLASKEHIISLIDGKAYKTLKRHLSNHGLTPADYRQRYGLKADYPMVAPAYAERRRKLAKEIGLGRKPRANAPAAATKPAAPRGRRKAAEAS